MSEDMKPCPFCGGEVEIETVEMGGNVAESTYYPICTTKGCLAHEGGVDDTIKEAVIRAWNKRVHDDTDCPNTPDAIEDAFRQATAKVGW